MALSPNASVPTHAAANGTTNTINLPTGVAVGDVCQVGIGIRNAATAISAKCGAGGNAWTSLATVTDSQNKQTLAVFRKILESGDVSTGNVTVTWTTSGTSIGATLAFSGEDTTTPEDATTTTAMGTGTAVSGTALTTVTAGAYLVFWVSGKTAGGNGEYSSWSTPTGEASAYTEQADQGDTVAVTLGLAIHIKTAAGASGTPSVTGLTNDRWSTALVAVRPLAGMPPGLGPDIQMQIAMQSAGALLRY